MPKIGKNGYHIYRSNGNIVTNIFNKDTSLDEQIYNKGSIMFPQGDKILAIHQNNATSREEKNIKLEKILKIAGVPANLIPDRLYEVDLTKVDSTTGETVTVFNKQKATNVVERIIKFFSEFNFSPSFRFVNTLLYSENPIAYTINYFMVQDHMYANDIAEKVKSPEFTEICRGIKSCGAKPKVINNRFELFFGAPGAGKTVKGYELTDTQMVCSSDMLPTDLMQNFAFSDGKAEFQKSDLWLAMEQGKKILLDEINMLPFESLRFIQGITDGKPSVSFKGFKINIHPDFKIYGTMNLNVNGQTIPIPEPLVDRASNLVEFKLTAEDLVRSLEFTDSAEISE